MERKLTAILSADVAGYSRLMGADEEATIRTLTTYRAVMASLIGQHRGRVVDSPGDNLLAEFASVVDAVRCAVEIQQELKARNAEVPDQRKMEFRIGINLGDVVVEGERLYGDGVNIAARLERLAEPGGICISGTVYDHIETKLALGYEYLGEQRVKNIAKPVRVWWVRAEPGAAAPTGRKTTANSAKKYWWRGVLVLTGLVLIVGGIVTVWYLSFPTLITRHSSLVTQPEPALPLPDKPSIAVLPFVNLSGDPEQEYFSDGMTEDLITDLSKLSGLFVIARNSTFFYKGKAVKIEEVGRELGVRYVLEGSVRKASDQVRITAQLVDATTSYHLWAERYDRPLQDLFALQDEIREKIVTALKVKLTKEEQERFQSVHADNLEAYDYALRGAAYYWHYTKETNAQARQMWEKAIALDPKFAAAYAGVGATYLVDWISQWSQDLQALERAFELAQKAVALDDSLPLAHVVLGDIYLSKKQHEQAIAELERAITIAPNFAHGYSDLGYILNFAGRPEEAIGLIEKATRLDPLIPNPHWLCILGHAYRLTGRYEEAIAAQKRALARAPNDGWPHSELVIIYSELGREEEARAEVAELRRLNPQGSLEVARQKVPYKDSAVLERDLAALRKAGLK